MSGRELDRCAPPRDAQGGKVRGEGPDRALPSVLCIGNDPLRLSRFRAFLREHKWQVLTAIGGNEGIISSRGESVKAVILDLDRDGSEGALVAAELKRLQPGVPIVILTTPGQVLVDGALQSADAVVSRMDELPMLLAALNRVSKAA